MGKESPKKRFGPFSVTQITRGTGHRSRVDKKEARKGERTERKRRTRVTDQVRVGQVQARIG